MAVGNTHNEPLLRFRDPATGREVVRLTDLQTHCHHPYFYSRAFTPDSRRLLYISHRTGRPCAYLLDIRTGESVQLTDCTDLSEFLLTLTQDGRCLYYSAGQELHRLALDTLDDAVVYVQQPPYTGNGIYPGYSDDFSKALLCQMHRDDVVPHKSGWDFFEPQCRAMPRCRLALLDLVSGKEQLVLEESRWLGHPQIRPGRPDSLMYCHEGPAHLIDARIWLIQADGSRNRHMGYYNPSPETGVREIVTHEYFTPDGRHIAYTHFPGTYGKDGSIRVMEVDAMRETVLGSVHNYSHFYHSPDCRRIVGDEAKRERPEENCVWLFDVETRRERPLCLHGSSFAPRGASTQDSHPHPTFSADGRHVVFTTDRETSPDGNCAVYLAETSGVFED